jgi:hypothetical protein
MGWALSKKGLYDVAIPHLERAASGQQNALHNYHLAITYFHARRPERGREKLAVALKLAPELPEAAVARELSRKFVK